MDYWILIFNQYPLGRFGKEDLLDAISASNFHTLCDQYGLEPALIQPGVEQLAVKKSTGEHVPLFFLQYQPINRPPIVVTEWDVAGENGKQLLADMIEGCGSSKTCEPLLKTRFIYSVELVESQLYDLGLLLAYEIARWATERGEGIVLGLDRTWYRLNTYKAFIPLT